MDYMLILNKILGFILTLYADPTLPRKIVQDVINYYERFIKFTFIPSLKVDILDILKEENISPNSFQRLEKCFNQHIDIFGYVNTEFKRFNLLRERGLIDEEELFIGRSYETEISEDGNRIVPDCMYAVHIPLKKSLKAFLEIPGFFLEIYNYMKNLDINSKIITNILQADLWKSKYSTKFMTGIVFPLYIFYDDLEVGNALGGHAGNNKFGTVYASIACLPSKIASRLDSIIFSTIFYTNDKKKSNNDDVFKVLIDEINFLQKEGILINVANKLIRVKFQLLLILGDNLGINGICGFYESFRAKCYCRICRASYTNCQTMTVEDETLLRNKCNYASDVASRNKKESGVKEECTFHKINDFHLTENVTVDMMHDFLEGVCIFILTGILESFIFIKGYFTLNELNIRIKNFDFGSENKPQEIKTVQGKNELHFKISASEMLQLMRYLGLINGDLVPRSDVHWNLYKLSCQILDIIMSPRVVRSDAVRLKEIIQFNFITH